MQLFLQFFIFFAIILLIIAFATADGDDYWAEGGMPLSPQPTD